MDDFWLEKSIKASVSEWKNMLKGADFSKEVTESDQVRFEPEGPAYLSEATLKKHEETLGYGNKARALHKAQQDKAEEKSQISKLPPQAPGKPPKKGPSDNKSVISKATSRVTRASSRSRPRESSRENAFENKIQAPLSKEEQAR